MASVIPGRRIVFDVATVMNAKGHSDGITRCARALMRYAADHRSDVIFAIYDTDVGAFRSVQADSVLPIIEGARVDTSHFPDPFAKKQRLRERMPARLKAIVFAIQRPRRRTFLLAERMRVKARGRPTPLLDRLQDWLMNDKYRAELAKQGGGRHWLLPYDMVIGDRIDLTPDDVVLLTGADWPVMRKIARRVDELNSPKLVFLCQDIIPMMFPQFFREEDAEKFRDCMHVLFPATSLLVLTTRRIESDVRAYCREQHLRLARTAIVPLGSDFRRAEQVSGSLPGDLQPGRYALFVSTIEPRKNHRTLLQAWASLLDRGVPQAQDFKLVFVGRHGWLVADLLTEISQKHSNDRVVLLSNIDDAALTLLYSQAAFCLYPSLYEGFGLPVIEAFRYGKALIASTGGALPETVAGFSPCLDPNDVNAWTEMMQTWIEDPSARRPYEEAIRNDFHPRSWDDAGRDLFEATEKMSDALPSA